MVEVMMLMRGCLIKRTTKLTENLYLNKAILLTVLVYLKLNLNLKLKLKFIRKHVKITKKDAIYKKYIETRQICFIYNIKIKIKTVF